MFFNPSRSIAGARCAALFALLLAARGGDAFAQSAILTDLHGFGPRQLKSQAFVLEASQDVQIEAVGAQASSKSAKLSALATMWQHDGKEAPAWSGNAWILESNSRKVVWELSLLVASVIASVPAPESSRFCSGDSLS